jgi:hypothetical protein
MLLCTPIRGNTNAHRYKGVYEYAIEMSLGASIYTPNFIKGDTQTGR